MGKLTCFTYEKKRIRSQNRDDLDNAQEDQIALSQLIIEDKYSNGTRKWSPDLRGNESDRASLLKK